MANPKAAAATSGNEATASAPAGADVRPTLAQLQLQLDATSRLAIERGVDITRAMNEITRHNLDTMFVLSRVATTGFGEIAAQLSKFAVNQAAEGNLYGRDQASITNPAELMAVHEARTRRLSNAMIDEVSALSEKLTEVSSSIMQTLESRSAGAFHQIKGVTRAAAASSTDRSSQ